MSDVFVSYKAEDRPRVEPLVEALEAEGLSVWWDAHVGGGQAWREAIADQLDSALCVLVVWSRRSTGPDGRFVRDEASRAQQRGTYLPVTIDKVQPPLGFGEMQSLRLTGWKGDTSDPHYRAVSACVHSMLGRTATTPAASPRVARIDRRTALAAGSGAIALAAGGAGWLFFRSKSAGANTIAVLPFANLSGDPSQDYFSDGMAEEVRSALAAAGSLEVVARTSSEMLRNADAVTAARRLDVANVVTGSVRRSPSTVRVSAQLVDGKDGLERWSQTFDRPFGDVLQIQSDIAANVAQALSIELVHSGFSPMSPGGTSNAQAQDFLLQAIATEGDDSGEGMLRRIALFNQATSLDPKYAEAFARRALDQELWASSYAQSTDEKIRTEAEALEAATRAISIAPEMSLGHVALGIIYRNKLMLNRALEALRRAAELPGANAAALLNYALVLSNSRRQNEAEGNVARAVSLDPLNATARVFQALILFWGRRYAQSLEAARRALMIAPENIRGRAVLGWDLLMLGRTDEALAELRKLPADEYRRLVAEATIAARAHRRDEALRAIDSLIRRYKDTIYYQMAEIYAQLGEADKAIAALEAAWSTRDPGMAAIEVDPFVDPLRTDLRFPAIARRIFS